MANFDFKNLFLINPCTLDDECYARAMHAKKVLDDAKIFKSFENSIKDIDFLIATSSVESKNEKRHLRNAFSLEDLSEKLHKIDGNIGLVFGREDNGLYNDEIAMCDAMLKIPTSENYPPLNLSHAVAVILYSIYIKRELTVEERSIIGKIEKEKLYSFFNELLNQIDYAEHKKENTEIMFKRIMGRAMPSNWEYHTLMGVFKKTIQNLKRRK